MAEALSAAFKAHPYRNPSGGWPSDIANLRRTEAQAFFGRYYVPGNITVAIVGDVTVAEVEAAGRALFRPHGSQTDAVPGDHGGTAADWSEDRSARDGRTARHGGGLQASEPVRQRRYCARPDPNPTFPGADRHPLQRTGSGETSRPTGAGDCDAPRRPICQPVCFPPGARAGPHGGGEPAGAGRVAAALQDHDARSATAGTGQGAGAGKPDSPDDEQRRTGGSYSRSTPPTMATGASCSRHWTIWIR